MAVTCNSVAQGKERLQTYGQPLTLPCTSGAVVFLKGLHNSINGRDLFQLFHNFGNLKFAHVVRLFGSLSSFGILVFSEETTAESMVELVNGTVVEFNGVQYLDRPLTVFRPSFKDLASVDEATVFQELLSATPAPRPALETEPKQLRLLRFQPCASGSVSFLTGEVTKEQINFYSNDPRKDAIVLDDSTVSDDVQDAEKMVVEKQPELSDKPIQAVEASQHDSSRNFELPQRPERARGNRRSKTASGQTSPVNSNSAPDFRASEAAKAAAEALASVENRAQTETFAKGRTSLLAGKENRSDSPDFNPTSSGTSLFIRNLHPQLSENQLWTLCLEFGTVVSTKVPCTPNGHSKGYGFVAFETAAAAQAALVGLQARVVKGRTLHVEPAKRRQLSRMSSRSE